MVFKIYLNYACYIVLMKLIISTIYYNWFALVLIRCIDYLLSKIELNEKIRWFQLHAITNMFICYFVINEVIECFINPNISVEKTNNEWGRSFALSLHIYHCIYFTLRKEDWIHHIGSVFIGAPLFILTNTKGVSVNYFFCTGLPGAVDYIMLTLMKYNYISRLQQKNICCYLNTYIRIPGGIVGAYLLFKDAFMYSSYYIHYRPLCLSSIIYLNATFYGKQAIGSYYKALTEDKY